jgi:hypothetical protein
MAEERSECSYQNCHGLLFSPRVTLLLCDLHKMGWMVWDLPHRVRITEEDKHHYSNFCNPSGTAGIPITAVLLGIRFKQRSVLLTANHVMFVVYTPSF